jgi:hypothetical protein
VWLANFHRIVTEALVSGQGAFSASALCLALYPRDRDLFRDFIESAIALLVAALDDLYERLILTTASSLDSALASLP